MLELLARNLILDGDLMGDDTRKTLHLKYTKFMNPWALVGLHVTEILHQKLCPRGERDRHAARKSKWEWSAEKLLDCPMKRGPVQRDFQSIAV